MDLLKKNVSQMAHLICSRKRRPRYVSVERIFLRNRPFWHNHHSDHIPLPIFSCHVFGWYEDSNFHGQPYLQESTSSVQQREERLVVLSHIVVIDFSMCMKLKLFLVIPPFRVNCRRNREFDER
jgi:hypothetical protein